MSERLELRAYAKINYALEVLGLREDGYHEVRTVMQSVSLADGVELERSGGGFELSVEPEETEIGPPAESTVYRAWALLREASGRELPVRVRLRKEIPAGAGLGGGSADAAAVLAGLDELFDLGLDAGELARLGAAVGVDVPFCLAGGTALGEGTGSRITPLPAPPAHHLMIAKPARSAHTAAIYRLYDRLPREAAPSVEPALAALRSGDLEALAGALGNDLEPVTRSLVPEVGAYRRGLLRAGALEVAMTGTGTAVYGIFADAPGLGAGLAELAATFIGTCKPVDRGVELLRDTASSCWEPYGAPTTVVL